MELPIKQQNSKKIVTAKFYILFLLLLFIGNSSFAKKVGNYTFSSPFKYKNLSIYMITGKESLPKNTEYVMFDLAAKTKILTIHETGSVNQLCVENTSKDKTIYLQAGDIVKGGKQDRVLANDLIIPPKSGKVSISSFCVEHFRWSKRGKEDSTKFSAGKRIIGKNMKSALRGTSRGQGNMWASVSANQMALNDKLKTNVCDKRSATSMQLTLENKDFEKAVKDYTKHFKDCLTKVPNAIGYAFVVNGKFSSCDIYGSNKIFKKLWPRMLDACIGEAVMEYDKNKKLGKESEKWMNEIFTKNYNNFTKAQKQTKCIATSKNNISKKYIGNRTNDLRYNKTIHESFDAIENNIPKRQHQLNLIHQSGNRNLINNQNFNQRRNRNQNQILNINQNSNLLK